MTGSISGQSLGKSSAEGTEKVVVVFDAVPSLTPEEERRLYRKIDFRCSPRAAPIFLMVYRFLGL
jgi:hypothetical protein